MKNNMVKNGFEKVAEQVRDRLLMEAGKDCDKWEILRDNIFETLQTEDGYSKADARKIMKLAYVGF